jgi:hypothetical protein
LEVPIWLLVLSKSYQLFKNDFFWVGTSSGFFTQSGMHERCAVSSQHCVGALAD